MSASLTRRAHRCTRVQGFLFQRRINTVLGTKKKDDAWRLAFFTVRARTAVTLVSFLRYERCSLGVRRNRTFQAHRVTAQVGNHFRKAPYVLLCLFICFPRRRGDHLTFYPNRRVTAAHQVAVRSTRLTGRDRLPLSAPARSRNSGHSASHIRTLALAFVFFFFLWFLVCISEARVVCSTGPPLSQGS